MGYSVCWFLSFMNTCLGVNVKVKESHHFLFHVFKMKISEACGWQNKKPRDFWSPLVIVYRQIVDISRLWLTLHHWHDNWSCKFLISCLELWKLEWNALIMGRAISNSNVWWKKIVMALWAHVFKAHTKTGWYFAHCHT